MSAGWRLIGLAALSLALASCDTASQADDTGAVCDREPALDYDNFGKGFLDQFCNGCHSSLVSEVERNGVPPGVDFDYYGAVMTWAERIDARTLAEDPATAMPPGGGPSAEERARLHEWIVCGVLPDAARWEGE